MVELERALRGLRLSGMTATLEARALQVASHEMNFLEAFSWLVQDELDRRRSRLQERRYALSGLPERKTLSELDWSYNPRLPKRDDPRTRHPQVHRRPRRRPSDRQAGYRERATSPKPSLCSPSSAGTRSSTARRSS